MRLRSRPYQRPSVTTPAFEARTSSRTGGDVDAACRTPADPGRTTQRPLGRLQPADDGFRLGSAGAGLGADRWRCRGDPSSLRGAGGGGVLTHAGGTGAVVLPIAGRVEPAPKATTAHRPTGCDTQPIRLRCRWSPMAPVMTSDRSAMVHVDTLRRRPAGVTPAHRCFSRRLRRYRLSRGKSRRTMLCLDPKRTLADVLDSRRPSACPEIPA